MKRQERPGSLPADLVILLQAPFESERAFRFKPLQKIFTPQAVNAFCQQHDRAALGTCVRSHVQSFVRLNQVDVVRVTAAANYY